MASIRIILSKGYLKYYHCFYYTARLLLDSFHQHKKTLFLRLNKLETHFCKLFFAKKVIVKAQIGFTLVELLVTVCVMAIIVTIALPSILTQLARMEARRIRTQVVTTLNIAKAESYIRRQDLIVCLSNGGGRCHRDSDKKILLFVDNNHNENFDDQTDYMIDEQTLNPKYSKLSLRVGSNRHYTKFWGDSGKPRGHFGHIKYCPTSTYNEAMYQISFNQNGIIKYKPNAVHDTEC